MPLAPKAPPPAPGPRGIADCGSLRGLFERAAVLTELDRQLRQHLPPTLAGQIRLGNVHGGRLVFVASSAAWASRLRLEQAAILRLARTLGVDARTLTIKVAPLPPPPPEAAAGPSLSPAAARHLRAAAAGITDPELRERFLALASLGGC